MDFPECGTSEDDFTTQDESIVCHVISMSCAFIYYTMLKYFSNFWHGVEFFEMFLAIWHLSNNFVVLLSNRKLVNSYSVVKTLCKLGTRAILTVYEKLTRTCMFFFEIPLGILLLPKLITAWTLRFTGALSLSFKGYLLKSYKRLYGVIYRANSIFARQGFRVRSLYNSPSLYKLSKSINSPSKKPLRDRQSKVYQVIYIIYLLFYSNHGRLQTLSVQRCDPSWYPTSGPYIN
jgi:hypothetical protein